MNIFISTATDRLIVTLFKDREIITTVNEQGNNDFTTKIYEKLEGIDLSSLKNVYFVNGPGSYTGLRVAIIAAKSIAIKFNCNLIPVNLLKLLYLQEGNTIKVDARGKRHFIFDGKNTNIIASVDVLNILEPVINEIQIIDQNLLSTFACKDITEVKIEYIKSAI